jgi:hypothetical protein
MLSDLLEVPLQFARDYSPQLTEKMEARADAIYEVRDQLAGTSTLAPSKDSPGYCSPVLERRVGHWFGWVLPLV